MARIRTVKPEFWTSAQVLECSTNARLLFVGLWNFSDDCGRHVYSPKQIKAEIYPADPFSEDDILGMLDELSSNGLVAKYVVDNKEYLQITGWHHQRIDRPMPAKCPPPPENFDDHSTNDRGPFHPDSKGEDSKGEEVLGTSPAGAAPPCPYQKIVDLYHETLPMCPRVVKLTDNRKSHLRARWRNELPALEKWRNYFSHVSQSDFLTGRTNGSNGRPPFLADLDWLIKPGNLVKVAEGKYHRSADDV